MEDNMHKLCLMLAAGVAALTMGTAAQAFYRPGFESTPVAHHGRLICTHFWNGHWHFRKICYPAPHHHPHHRY